jgi:uncharacterized membrane protein
MLQLEKNIKNKTWWVAIISALILLAQSHGLDLTKYIGTNWQDTLNTIFSILVLLGVSVDTTTVKTSSDASTTNSTENTVSTATDSTNTNTSVSSNSTDISASSKIIVDNPDNVQAIGQEVNATGATSPSAN